jgi:hypothetical protein
MAMALQRHYLLKEHWGTKCAGPFSFCV